MPSYHCFAPAFIATATKCQLGASGVDFSWNSLSGKSTLQHDLNPLVISLALVEEKRDMCRVSHHNTYRHCKCRRCSSFLLRFDGILDPACDPTTDDAAIQSTNRWLFLVDTKRSVFNHDDSCHPVAQLPAKFSKCLCELQPLIDLFKKICTLQTQTLQTANSLAGMRPSKL